MRARYSAHVLGDEGFLHRSWHPDTRPGELSLDPDHRWTGLTIVETVGGGGLESDGIVEFVARYTKGNGSFQLHERSRFTRVGGRWLYVDGSRPAPS